MPINVYTGLMRSGKSYEVVSEVICAAIATGRRVVTNVDGIDSDLIREYVERKKDVPIEQLGHVIHCHNEDVFKPDFFPYYDDCKSAVTNTFVQPGDLVCIDEAWRFWGTDCKIHKNHRSFFLEHGHFVHPERHIACDLVLMIQDMGTLHRSVRSVVAFSFRTHKKVALGMSNTYSVNMWEGSKMAKGSLCGKWVRKYNKEIFPLYSSFKGGVQGKLINADNRQNTLLNPRLWIVLGVAVVGGSYSVYNVWKFFHPIDKQATASGVAVAQGDATKSTAANVVPKVATPSFSDSWRIAGTYSVSGQRVIVLTNASGRLRVESPSVFTNVGYAQIGEVDGERVAVWTGAHQVTMSPAEARK
jgi:zona occludens toxin